MLNNEENKLFLWNGNPLKKLTKGLKNKGGRNNKGRIVNFRKSSRHKRLYRQINFVQKRFYDIEGVVRRIEYDPNRTVNIGLICYKNGYLCYHLAVEGLKVGDIIICSNHNKNIIIKKGNRYLLKYIPIGTLVSSIELNVNSGAKLARSAGTSALIVNKYKNKVTIRLNSGVEYVLNENCFATIGQNSNIKHKLSKLYKAGQNRWKGKKPSVRGVAMNPIDHPHGGGEGKKSPRVAHLSPWGKITKGVSTRKKKLWSDNFIKKKRKK